MFVNVIAVSAAVDIVVGSIGDAKQVRAAVDWSVEGVLVDFDSTANNRLGDIVEHHEVDGSCQANIFCARIA